MDQTRYNRYGFSIIYANIRHFIGDEGHKVIDDINEAVMSY
jgi:hypothetical protein